MKARKSTTKHHVYLGWLRSELYRKKDELSDDELSIIEQPDLKDDKENAARETLLLHKYGRSAIIDKLPGQIVWHEAIVEKKSKDKMFILPVLDWFMDTGKTFQLKDVETNLSSKRGHRLPNYPHMPNHHKKIYEIVNSKKPATGRIIAISTSTDGPYTVIDGTHRSSALDIQGKLHNAPAFLGVAENLSNCIWSIERKDIDTEIMKFNSCANSGLIW